MAIHFDRWEKDPFFSPAEEVQESSDRMESTYRRWLAACKDESGGGWNKDQIRRDLCTALGTAKWQLEEFERAVISSYKKNVADEAKDRHRQFIIAIEEKISQVEKSLQESSALDGKSSTQWVRLDDGERDEFALFLSGPSGFGGKLDIKVDCGSEHANRYGRSTNSVSSSWRKASYASELHLMDDKDVELPGLRRTASASADIGWLNIAVSEDMLKYASCNGLSDLPPHRVPSYSGFLNTMESASILKIPKNGFRKWKAGDRRNEDDDISLLNPEELSGGTIACYERSKSCLNTGDEQCDKQLYGWYGALQRLLQRSQYQVQYSRPIQLTCWTAILLFFIVLFILRPV